MTDEGALFYAKLTDTPEVVAIFGTRIYPTTAPQGAQFPVCVYDRHVEPMATKDGFAGTDVCTVTAVAWADTADAAMDGARAIRKATMFTTQDFGNAQAHFVAQSILSGRETESEMFFAQMTIRVRISQPTIL